MDICIYHKNCRDGFAAALVVWMKYGDDVEFIPATYGDVAPDVKGKDVIIVDFSYPRQVLELMNEDSNSLLVIDHHKTAQENLKDLDYCVFNMNKSGCTLTWDTLYPNDKLSIPKFFLYIEDRDLWKWRFPETKAVNSAILMYPQEFYVWMRFTDNDDLDKLIDEGEAIIKYQEQIIKKILDDGPDFVEIGGHLVPVVNSSHYEINSDLVGEMCRDDQYPFAASYADTYDTRVFSLRSRGEFDVSEIAKQYGGGGHKNAAGFTVDKPNVL